MRAVNQPWPLAKGLRRFWTRGRSGPERESVTHEGLVDREDRWIQRFQQKVHQRHWIWTERSRYCWIWRLGRSRDRHNKIWHQLRHEKKIIYEIENFFHTAWDGSGKIFAKEQKRQRGNMHLPDKRAEVFMGTNDWGGRRIVWDSFW